MGVTEETLKITNEVVYKGKDDARRLKTDLKTTEAQAKKTGMSFDQMAIAGAAVVAGFAAVTQAAKIAYQTLNEGAQIQAAALTFDSLAMSIGSTSDAMLGDLQAATRGTIDDMTLMQSASQFAAMGLANNSTEAAKLAEIGSTLGAAFRGDAAAGMEEFALLLANQSIPRLDSFGISAGAVRSRIAELQAEFPDMNRETAFMTAVMEESEGTMAKLGDTSETAAVQLAQIESVFKNINDSAKANLAEGAIPLLAEFNDAVQAVTGKDVDSRQVVEFWKGFFLVPTVGFRTLTNTINDFDELLDNFSIEGALALAPVNEAFRAFQEVTGELGVEGTGSFSKVESGFEDITAAADEFVRLTPRYGTSMDDMGAAHDQFTAAVDRSTDAVTELSTFSNSTFIDTLNSTEVAALDVERALLKQAAAAGADETSLVLLAAATGDYTDEQINAALEMATMTAFIDSQAQALADGDITWQQALNTVQAFRNELAQIPDVITVDILVQQSGQFVPPDTTQNYGNQGGGGTGGNAAGTATFAGGYSMVGEFGPEMVRLPRGAQVVSTNQTHNQTSNTTINGTSRRAERMIQKYIRGESRPKRMG